MSLLPNLWLPLNHVFMFVILENSSKWSQCGILDQNLIDILMLNFLRALYSLPRDLCLHLTCSYQCWLASSWVLTRIVRSTFIVFLKKNGKPSNFRFREFKKKVKPTSLGLGF